MEKEFKTLSEKIRIFKGSYILDPHHVKEFIKWVEKIIIERKSRRLQLLELKKAAGKGLIENGK